MKFKLISKSKNKAEIIVMEPTTYGIVYTTRHLKLTGNTWTDKHGNRFEI